MAVANTKNLWETGQVQTQSAAKTTSNKVGARQGGGGPSRLCQGRDHRGCLRCLCVPSTQDIVAGDLSKRSFWEQRGGSTTSSTVKVGSAGTQPARMAQSDSRRQSPLLRSRLLSASVPAEHPVREEVQVCGHRTREV